MSSFTSLLTIDARSVTDSIEEYIQRVVDTSSARGVIIGLSGGLDSAVLAALAVRALHKERVHVCYLYERDSSKQSRRRAILMADWLDLELRLHDIAPIMRQRQIYTPLIMRISTLSGSVNRLLISVYRFFYGESPFTSTLHKGSFSGHKLKKFFYDHTARHAEAAFNVRHIYRRQFLEKLAKDHNLLLLGAGNRSEYLAGWFVKDGIDDMPFSPLLGLYKTQVRQLADFLGLPSEIRSQPPSPDMVKGVTDEFAIDISYTTLDIILDGLDRGLPDEQIVAAGASEKQISHVRKINQLSAWKRPSGRANQPVDGRVGGGFRGTPLCGNSIRYSEGK